MIEIDFDRRALARAIGALNPRRLEAELAGRRPPGSSSASERAPTRADATRPGRAGRTGDDEDISDEDTERRAWYGPRRWIRLPLAIRWGHTPKQRISKAGTPYLRVPLSGRSEGGRPVVRTITPTSPGWLVPDRRADLPRGPVLAARSRALPAVPRSSLPLRPGPTAPEPPAGRPGGPEAAPATPRTGPRLPAGPAPTPASWAARVSARIQAFVIRAFAPLTAL